MASFLAPILRAPEQRFSLWIERNRDTLATQLETAFDSTRRRRGLLGRSQFPQGAALIIAPSNSVHTFFMRMTIDLVFASRDGQVLKTYANLPPWRMAFAIGAFAVVELPADTLTRIDIRPGDQLRLSSDETPDPRPLSGP